jgi:hypothetical protein
VRLDYAEVIIIFVDGAPRAFSKQFLRIPGDSDLIVAVIKYPSATPSFSSQQTGKVAQECLFGTPDAFWYLIHCRRARADKRLDAVVYLGFQEHVCAVGFRVFNPDRIVSGFLDLLRELGGKSRHGLFQRYILAEY